MSKAYHQKVFVKDLVSALKKLHFQKEKTPSTETLNNTLKDVAINYALSVWGKKLDESDNPNRDKSHISGHEWLYDMVCYKYDKEHYALNETILVMESEWKGKRYASKGHDGNDPYGEVKYDFQKLLLANADVKLMVYRHHKENYGAGDSIKQYFQRRIDSYRQGRVSDLFLFACYSGAGKGKLKCTVSSYIKTRGWKEL